MSAALGPVRRALGEHLVHDALVGEAEHVVEVLLGVLGIAARVGSAEHRDGAALAEEVAQRVGELRGLGEGADEEDVEVRRQLRQQVFAARVADVGTS